MERWYSLPGLNQPVSSLSHLVGAIVFAVLSFFLLRPVLRDRERFWRVAVFAGAAVTLLCISGLYHTFKPGGTVRAVLLRLDVAAIFILIAASFTPVHGCLFDGWKRWGVLCAIWTVAFVGLTLRMIFFDSITPTVGRYCFLLMGWLGAISGYLMWRSFGWQIVFPVVIGGIFYTMGAVSEVIGWPIFIPHVWGPHETFHFTVLAGLGCHWSVVSQIAEGRLVKPCSKGASNRRPSRYGEVLWSDG